MADHGELTAEVLRELLEYDRETGLFRWRVNRRSIRKGSVAGGQHCTGYWLITVNGRPYLAHRLAWLHVLGEWPDGNLDHANRQRSDNRIANLRQATQSQNRANSASTNATGYRGVYLEKRRGKYYAQIKVLGQRFHLGFFTTAEAAAEAYSAAAIEHYGAFAGGSR